MDKFLRNIQLTRLNYEKIENLDIPIMTKELEAVIKTLLN